jgi:hypothetical protein
MVVVYGFLAWPVRMRDRYDGKTHGNPTLQKHYRLVPGEDLAEQKHCLDSRIFLSVI